MFSQVSNYRKMSLNSDDEFSPITKHDDEFLLLKIVTYFVEVGENFQR